jgi:anthranilate phosphoribosyltransferase
MNLLGPLLNPAGVRRQVIGVADVERAPIVAGALAELGSRHALVLHADVGMDEVSPSGLTRVWEVCDGTLREWALDPAAVGCAHDDLAPLAGGEPAENARRIETVLSGGGAAVERAAVVLNAAAALYVAGRGWSYEEAVRRAAAALDDGSAAAALERLRRPPARAVSTSG